MANDGCSEQRAKAENLRSEVEELVRQALLLLNGEAGANRPQPPPTARRAERERELESVLEKVDWHRREIKRLRQELEQREQQSSVHADPRDRDPRELKNILAEKQRELKHLKHEGEGLDRLASAQRRAQAEQNAVRPNIADKLKEIKDQVEQQKRQNVKLHSERHKANSAKKVVERNLREAAAEARSRAAQVQPVESRDAKPRGGKDDNVKIRQMRQNIDILREALRQDERRFKIEHKEDSQEVEFARGHIAELRESVAKREREVKALEAQADRAS